MTFLKYVALFLALGPCALSVRQFFGGDEVREARFVNGNDCEGRLEIRPDASAPFGQACDVNRGAPEAMVACRMLGCNPVGARRVDPTQFGFREDEDVNVYRSFNVGCTGDENSFSECRQGGGSTTCSVGTAESVVAIACGSSGTNAGSVFIVFSLGVLALIYNTMKWII